MMNDITISLNIVAICYMKGSTITFADERYIFDLRMQEAIFKMASCICKPKI